MKFIYNTYIVFLKFIAVALFIQANCVSAQTFSFTPSYSRIYNLWMHKTDDQYQVGNAVQLQMGYHQPIVSKRNRLLSFQLGVYRAEMHYQVFEPNKVWNMHFVEKGVGIESTLELLKSHKGKFALATGIGFKLPLYVKGLSAIEEEYFIINSNQIQLYYNIKEEPVIKQKNTAALQVFIPIKMNYLFVQRNRFNASVFYQFNWALNPEVVADYPFTTNQHRLGIQVGF